MSIMSRMINKVIYSMRYSTARICKLQPEAQIRVKCKMFLQFKIINKIISNRNSKQLKKE